MFRVTNLSPDGSTLLLDRSVTPQNRTDLIGAVKAVPDGHGNLLLTGLADAMNFPPTDGTLTSGACSFVVMRLSDGAIVYSTHLPSAGTAAPDGKGGFIVLGGAGTSTFAYTLTHLIPDSRSRTSVVGLANAAELYTSAKIAPGEIVNIFGVNLGPDGQLNAVFDASGRLPFTLGGTEVYFNGLRAPLLSVGSQQVSAIVPFASSTSGRVAAEVRVNGVVSNILELPASASAPKIVASPNLYAVALNQDGTVNGANNPAAYGEIVSVFINGAGPLTPAPDDGTRGRAGQLIALPFLVEAGGVLAPTEVTYAGAAPGEVAGVTQVNLRVPTLGSPRPSTGLEIRIGEEVTYANIWVMRPR
jgi:uncharacterized protein (TIGR03437 family)